MKSNKTLYSVFLASTVMILFLSIISSTASAATGQSGSPTITESQISHSGTAACPTIYGNTIVWLDWRNGEDNADIYMYDLSTSQETQVSYSERVGGSNAIYDNKIVWAGSPTVHDNSDIYVYDLSTSQKTQISYSGYASIPKIYDNRIVWVDNSDAKVDIHMYDLYTSQETQITHSGSAESPSIYGNKIVYVDYHGGVSTSSVYMYDLSTFKEFQISYSGAVANPAIYGNKIVWEDLRNGQNNADIYMYDLSTSQETQITTNESYQGSPAICGDRIVWQDNRNGNWDIYMYDLSTSQETQITANDFQQDSPATYDNMIVWTDWRNGNANIYMGTLSEEKPTLLPPDADFSAIPTSGSVPLEVKFTSTSTGSPTAWKWNFGDGSDLVTDQNPKHIYSKAGVYTVKNTAINAYGRSTEIKTNYITVRSAPPIAAFSVSATTGSAPLKVKFIDTSTGNPTAWKWSFGDGSALVTQYNPIYTYSKPGTYTVKETISNAAGKDTEIKTNYITVTAPLKAPVAAFTASPRAGKAPLKVQFTDKSINNPTSWKWSFGDGKYSTSKSPLHTYTRAGKYTVYLTVKNAKGSSTKNISGYIMASK